MKKLERYEITDFGYLPLSDGDVSKSEDVAMLEAKYAQLEAINAQMLEALEKIAALDYTMGGINCFCWKAHTIADAAIAKAKGEQP